MSEARLRQAIKKKWDKIRVYGVENHSDPGMPDLHFIFKEVGKRADTWGAKSNSGWIELKYVKQFGKVKFRPNQPSWIKEYNQKGGNILVLVATEDKKFYLFWGRHVDYIANAPEEIFKKYAICRTASLTQIEDEIICALT